MYIKCYIQIEYVVCAETRDFIRSMDVKTRSKLSRSALRNHCKKIEGQIIAMTGNYDPANSVKLTTLKQNYTNQITRIKAVNAEIENLIEDQAELEADLENSLLEEDIHYTILSQIDNCLVVVTPDTQNSVPSPNELHRREAQTVKLPRIQPPVFDGSILHWQTFWDQYESCVHNQRDLSDVDKFAYFKSLLTSSASECVSGLTLSNANYAEAIRLLQERFGNTQLLINAYMESFVKLPVVKSMNQVAELRVTYDQLETTVRNLKTVNVEIETYGSFLVPLLTQKLPDELAIIMSRKFRSTVWDLKEMLIIFKDELEAKERCPVSAANTISKREKSTPFSTMNLHQQQQRNQKPNRRGRSCPFCREEGHTPSRCPNVTDAKSRKAQLRRKGRCFVCLQSGHISYNCQLEYQCKKCDERHNISICDSDVNTCFKHE